MALFRRSGTDETYPKDDRGAGSFDDYKYSLVPNNAKVRLRLANSAPYQAELESIVASAANPIETATPRRSAADEKVDAPIEIRLFVDKRVSGVVGVVPRGLESIVDETFSRLDIAGRKPRIPVEIVKTRAGYRVELLIGLTR